MLLLLMTGTAAYAQNTVTGTVLDDSGFPLTGTSVLVEGTTVGTTTDIDGKYSIRADKGAVLMFDFIGFDPQRVTVGDKSVIDVVMKTSAEFLEETVVIGYGVQKKVNVTGSVATVNYSDIAESRPVTTTAAMLRGIKVSKRFSVKTWEINPALVAPYALRTPSSLIRSSIREEIMPQRFMAGMKSKASSI